MAKKTEEKLQKVLKCINNFASKNGYPPTIREICKEMNINSTATVQYYLKALEKNGSIKRDGTKNRAIEVISKNSIEQKNKPEIDLASGTDEFISVPVIGKVAAGVPILAVENIEERICVPTPMFKGNDLYSLNVSGDSMINCGILDGDKIIVRRQNTAKNGEIAVALVDDSVTVKRFFKENNQYRLQPENDYMSPIIVNEVEILGVVVGLIRKI